MICPADRTVLPPERPCAFASFAPKGLIVSVSLASEAFDPSGKALPPSGLEEVAEAPDDPVCVSVEGPGGGANWENARGAVAPTAIDAAKSRQYSRRPNELRELCEKSFTGTSQSFAFASARVRLRISNLQPRGIAVAKKRSSAPGDSATTWTKAVLPAVPA